MFGRIFKTIGSYAKTGIMDDDLVFRRSGEHDIMRQIPMQDGGRLQVTQLIQLQPQRTRREPQLFPPST